MDFSVNESEDEFNDFENTSRYHQDIFSSDEEEEDTYMTLLMQLAHMWLSAVVSHDLSLTAAGYLWKIAFEFIGRILFLKKSEGIQKNVPQFKHLRNKLMTNLVPPIWIRMAFRDLETNSVITPPPSKIGHLKPFANIKKYEKLYEITYTTVNEIIKIHRRIHSNHCEPVIDISCD